MPNRNYLSGRNFEYQLMKYYRDELKYDVIRASGSHGKFDIVAFRPQHPPEFIQAKVVGNTKSRDRVLKEFIKNIIPSKYYHQTIAIKVKGSKDPFLTYTA